MLENTILDQPIAKWAELHSKQDAQGQYIRREDGSDLNYHQEARTVMEGLVLAIVTQAALVTRHEVEREIERALAPKPSRVRAVCGRVLRQLAHLVDPSS